MKTNILINKIVKRNEIKPNSNFFLRYFNRFVSIIIILILVFSFFSFKALNKNNKVDPDNPGGGPTFEIKIPATNNKKAIP